MKNQIFVNFSGEPVKTPISQKSLFSAKSFEGIAMIDCSATSCFIHPDLAKDFQLPHYRHLVPKKLRVIDG